MPAWRDHEWENTGKTEQALVTLYRLWCCSRCDFRIMQPDGVQPIDFELVHGEWDCDLQMIRKVMEG